jgi:hypothetical protein
MVRGESLLQVAGPLAVLLVTAALAAAFNSLVFRWESSEPINYKKLAVAVGGLLALYAVASMLAPAMRMAVSPAPPAVEQEVSEAQIAPLPPAS